jgi:hypothetical protein
VGRAPCGIRSYGRRGAAGGVGGGAAGNWLDSGNSAGAEGCGDGLGDEVSGAGLVAAVASGLGVGFAGCVSCADPFRKARRQSPVTKMTRVIGTGGMLLERLQKESLES